MEYLYRFACEHLGWLALYLFLIFDGVYGVIRATIKSIKDRS